MQSGRRVKLQGPRGSNFKPDAENGFHHLSLGFQTAERHRSGTTAFKLFIFIKLQISGEAAKDYLAPKGKPKEKPIAGAGPNVDGQSLSLS